MSIFAGDSLESAQLGARRAFAWWLGELRAAYRDAARRVAAMAHGTLTIEAGEHSWLVRRKRGVIGTIDWPDADAEAGRHALRRLAAQAGGHGALLVEIPPERVLSRVIHLPAAARRELDRILLFEVGRHFPFAAERMFYRYRVIGGSGAPAAADPSALSVEIAAVPRDVVASIAGELAAAGLRASAIALRAAPGSPPHLLGSEALAGGARSPASRLPAGAVALLALVAVASWPAAQQFRLAQLQREIAAVKPRAEAVLAAREARRRDAAQADAIARLRAGRPPLIAVLDALSRDVPDGSWLTALSISGRDVVLEGLSPSAATIALDLGRNPLFGGVSFRSPIARDPASGLEHFRLGVAIEARGR